MQYEHHSYAVHCKVDGEIVMMAGVMAKVLMVVVVSALAEEVLVLMAVMMLVGIIGVETTVMVVPYKW